MSEARFEATVPQPVEALALDRAPLDSVALEAAWRQVMDDLGGDKASHAAGDEYLAHTNALYHGGPVQWSFVPKIFSRRDISYLAWIAETTAGIMDKLTQAYIDDERVRALFGFDPVIDDLVRALAPYAQLIPIARVDIFLNDETGAFKFCEFNTDGSSGMLVTREVSRANLLTETGKRFASGRDVRVFDIYTPCAQAVLDAYRAAGGSSARPVVAAVDYRESIVAEEICEFRSVFATLGAELRFTDIRDLTYEDGILRDAFGPIDAVWRRVVISEMLEKPCAGAAALMACVRDGRVPVVGSFKTWPCATKTVFAALFDPAVRPHLTPEECAFIDEHVPHTFILDASSDLSRFAERARWIAKPRDGYNSVGVRAGRDCTQEEWREVLDETARTGGVVQEYVTPHTISTVEGGVAGEERPLSDHFTMEGLFLFGGKFGGVFTRCGAASVIGEFAGRLNMGCLVVDE